MAPTIYKIISDDEWRAACRAGVFEGVAVDRADGFIHFSTASQAPETAARHFAGRTGLLLVAVDAASLGDRLRWEPSRGGALFPHLYGPLDPARILWERGLPLGVDGLHLFGELLP